MINYEGQAAIELEMIVQPEIDDFYPFSIQGEIIDTAPVIRAVVADVLGGAPAGVIASRFHNGIALMIQSVCGQLRERESLNTVALSGGVFQNVTLLGKTMELLNQDGFNVITHHMVPPNDGGISLGQAVIASKHLGED